MDTIKVVCGLIYDSDKIFICRRKEEKSLGGLWEFPGGKVELDETYEDCLKRELKEELEMDVDIIRHFKTVRHNYDSFIIELISMICDYKSSNYLMTDHDMYEWVNSNDLLSWKLAPADIAIAEALIAERC